MQNLSFSTNKRFVKGNHYWKFLGYDFSLSFWARESLVVTSSKVKMGNFPINLQFTLFDKKKLWKSEWKIKYKTGYTFICHRNFWLKDIWLFLNMVLPKLFHYYLPTPCYSQQRFIIIHAYHIFFMFFYSELTLFSMIHLFRIHEVLKDEADKGSVWSP